MKNLKSLLSQTLTWEFEKKKIFLKSNDEIVLELKQEKATRSSFKIDDKNYVLRQQGFWNPKTILEKEGEPLLTLKHSLWTSKGKIEFANGNQYICKIRNSPLVKLTFLTMDEEEIVHYKLHASLNPGSIKTIMNINPNSIPDRDLLMLIILGCFCFHGIVIENQNNDFITIAAGA